MSFDETLRQAFETLTDRLRDEIAGALSGVAADLAAAAQTDRDQAAAEAANDARVDADRDAARRIAESESAATARIAEVERHAVSQIAEAERGAASRIADAQRAADARLFEAVAAAEAAARENGRVADLAASERLLHAIRAIDRASSLSEILDTLLFAAGREAARAGILLVRGTSAIGWRFVGSGGFGFALDAAHETPLTLDVAAPGVSGVIGDAVRTGVAASSDTAGGLSRPPFDLPDGRERVALPIPMSGQVVAVLYADQGAAADDDPARAIAIAWPSVLEVLTRHAARSLEALTAFQAARVLTERPDVAAPVAPPLAPEGRQSDDEEAARRYARLLVSEIKLYHEPAVAAGRQGRDLASRLADEIARARALYEQRVPAAIRQRTGYFDAELVRTLANGDATLLGQST